LKKLAKQQWARNALEFHLINLLTHWPCFSSNIFPALSRDLDQCVGWTDLGLICHTQSVTQLRWGKENNSLWAPRCRGRHGSMKKH